MRIDLINIDGFGMLHGLEASLNPRLNLFLGENEAGKSTLQQAILALLYGFYHGARAAPKEREVHERYRPWQGGPYGGSIVYTLGTGDRFRIQRDFTTDGIPTAVIDLATGRDIAPELGAGRHGNVPVAMQHLGMRQEVFLSTCFISQGAPARIDSPSSVAETLVSIADTATADTSAADAIRRLTVALSAQVGGPTARNTPLPVARRKIQEVTVELQKLDAALRAVEDNLARKAALEEQHAGLNQRHRLVSYARISGALDDARATLSQVEKLDHELVQMKQHFDALKEYRSFPLEMRDEVLAAKGRLDTLVAQRDERQKRWERAAPGTSYGLHWLIAAWGVLVAAVSVLGPAIVGPGVPAPAMVALVVLLAGAGAYLLYRLYARNRPSSPAAARLRVEREPAQTARQPLRPRVLKQQLDESTREASAAGEHLLALLQRAGIDEADVEKGIALFEEGHAKRSLLDSLEGRSQAAAAQREALLNGKTNAALLERVAYLEAEKATALTTAPELAGATTEASLHELEIEMAELDRQLGRINNEAAGLDATIKTTLSGHRPRSDIEEDIARYQGEVTRLERFAEALTLARDTLKTASEEVHRDFAPRLGKVLGEGLAIVTSERYTTAYVDPQDFTIRVQTPHSSAPVEAGLLSTGAREQAYLLLRMELARMLSARREKLPLILDDPFVNYDEKRLARVLQLLVHPSEENQVLLFTKDAHIAWWLQSNCAQGQDFKLHTLSPDTPPSIS